MKIAVTGAGGFIGRALVAQLQSAGYDCVAIARAALADPDFRGVETVIHCAGIAHRSTKNAADASEMDAVNHRLTVTLAEQAAAAGVKRFVFVSTINVIAGHPSPLTTDLAYCPRSDYGRAKALAEQALLKMAARTARTAHGHALEIVIARPALTYGAGAPGNLHALLRLCDSTLPLPFGCADNQRSFVALHQVSDALQFLATAPSERVAGRVFHLADPQLLATRQLVVQLRQWMNRRAHLLPVPRFVMKTALGMLGKQALYQQLFDDLVVDGHDLEQAGFVYRDGQADLQQMVQHYLTTKAG